MAQEYDKAAKAFQKFMAKFIDQAGDDPKGTSAWLSKYAKNPDALIAHITDGQIKGYAKSKNKIAARMQATLVSHLEFTIQVSGPLRKAGKKRAKLVPHSMKAIEKYSDEWFAFMRLYYENRYNELDERGQGSGFSWADCLRALGDLAIALDDLQAKMAAMLKCWITGDPVPAAESWGLDGQTSDSPFGPDPINNPCKELENRASNANRTYESQKRNVAAVCG